jgi:hypothetical protein
VCQSLYSEYFGFILRSANLVTRSIKMTTISISQQDIELILEKVNNVRYVSVADVVHAALGALDELERLLPFESGDPNRTRAT